MYYILTLDLALLLGALQDPLFNRSLADEAIDGDLLGLAQPVGPVHGLLVHRGVPVTVVEDDLEEERNNICFSRTAPISHGGMISEYR